jgi:UDP-N-acetyl-2-amino-2-deoxyglucuronate dehydrogenase
MTEPIRIALIGCGRIAGHHARAIALVEGAELVAVCDLDETKARAYAVLHKTAWFTNYHEMLRRHPEIDTVAVITPSGMHFEHGLEILEGYAKNLIVEKPTFLKPSHLDSARSTASRLGVSLYPVFQNRYNSAVQRVRQALDTGELGEIRVMSVRTRWCRPQRYYDLAQWRGTFSHDGGALTNQGIHHIDLLRYLGGDVERVNATMRTLGADIEAEDTVVATFTYKGGAVGNLEVTTAARPDDFEASLSIVGSKGLVQLGGIAVNELQVFTPDLAACAAFSEDFGFSVYGNGHEKMYRDVASAARGIKPYPVSLDDCRATLALLHAFYRSDETGNWVDVDTMEESNRLGRPNEAVSDLYRVQKPAVAAVTGA